MANGTTVNAEQLVKLRKRTSASGNTILFLDYVQFGERVRESIGLTLLPGSTLAIKEKNRLTMSKAQGRRPSGLKRRSSCSTGTVTVQIKAARLSFSPTTDSSWRIARPV